MVQALVHCFKLLSREKTTYDEKPYFIKGNLIKNISSSVTLTFTFKGVKPTIQSVQL